MGGLEDGASMRYCGFYTTLLAVCIPADTNALAAIVAAPSSH